MYKKNDITAKLITTFQCQI